MGVEAPEDMVPLLVTLSPLLCLAKDVLCDGREEGLALAFLPTESDVVREGGGLEVSLGGSVA